MRDEPRHEKKEGDCLLCPAHHLWFFVATAARDDRGRKLMVLTRKLPRPDWFLHGPTPTCMVSWANSVQAACLNGRPDLLACLLGEGYVFVGPACDDQAAGRSRRRGIEPPEAVGGAQRLLEIVRRTLLFWDGAGRAPSAETAERVITLVLDKAAALLSSESSAGNAADGLLHVEALCAASRLGLLQPLLRHEAGPFHSFQQNSTQANRVGTPDKDPCQRIKPEAGAVLAKLLSFVATRGDVDAAHFLISTYPTMSPDWISESARRLCEMATWSEATPSWFLGGQAKYLRFLRPDSMHLPSVFSLLLAMLLEAGGCPDLCLLTAAHGSGNIDAIWTLLVHPCFASRLSKGALNSAFLARCRARCHASMKMFLNCCPRVLDSILLQGIRACLQVENVQADGRSAATAPWQRASRSRPQQDPDGNQAFPVFVNQPEHIVAEGARIRLERAVAVLVHHFPDNFFSFADDDFAGIIPAFMDFETKASSLFGRTGVLLNILENEGQRRSGWCHRAILWKDARVAWESSRWDHLVRIVGPPLGRRLREAKQMSVRQRLERNLGRKIAHIHKAELVLTRCKGREHSVSAASSSLAAVLVSCLYLPYLPRGSDRTRYHSKMDEPVLWITFCFVAFIIFLRPSWGFNHH
jgi:hypothetical protein